MSTEKIVGATVGTPINPEKIPSKSPKIGENGNWWTWDGKEYVDSGFSASGDGNTTESTSLKLTDTITGTVYNVTITNGKLTLTEVE
jgi:hypothetical protein